MNKDVAALQEFIVHNEELELLESRMKVFNPLKVLGVEYYEIRHSNVLAWLIDPKENHNLGEKILKKILCEIIVNNEYLDLPLSISDVQTRSFYDAEIKREWKNIDILAVSKSNNLVLLVENKVYSKEYEAQISGYIQKVKDEYPGYEILPVLLSLTDEEDGNMADPCYAGLSYEHIYGIIKSTTDLCKENMAAKVYDFISFYLKTVEVLTMQENNEVIKLCKEIYNRHKEAIDMVISYGITSPLDNDIDKFKKDNDIVEISRNKNRFFFLPKKLEKKMPKIAENWSDGYPIAFWYWFSQKDNQIGIAIEVGPFKDPHKRTAFMELLSKSGKFKIKKQSLALESQYTRIFSKYLQFNAWEESEKIIGKMNDLLSDKAKEATANIMELVDQFKWK